MSERRLILLLTIFFVGRAGAAPPLDELLPRTTRRYIAAPDLARFRDGWRKTGYFRVMEREDVKPSLDNALAAGVDGLGLGLSFPRLREVATGPIGWAVLPGQLFAMETTAENSARVRADVLGRLKKLGYAASTVDFAGVAIERWDGPAGQSRFATFYDGLLLFCDRADALEDVLKRHKDRGTDGLASHLPYRDVRERSRSGVKEPFDLTLYFDPFGLADDGRAGRKVPRDGWAIAKKEGFDAIKAIGGGVRFGSEPFDAAYRFAVHAPPPHRQAMRMVRLEAGRDFRPPDFVPPNAALVGGLNGDHAWAFRHVSSLVDSTLTPGIPGAFAVVLQSLKLDTDGPGVDIEKEIIGALGKQLTVLSVPSTPGAAGEMVLAAEATNPAGPAAAFRKLFDGDKETKRHDVAPGVVLWEVPLGLGRRVLPGDRPLKLCVSAARGHVFASASRPALEAVLRTNKTTMPADPDYRRVVAELDRVAPRDAALRWFTRADFDFRVAYESLRKGDADASSSLYAYVLSQVLSATTGLARREKLPLFEALRPYFGPSGLWIANSETGWLLGGFALQARP